jgi:hypothetical protein
VASLAHLLQQRALEYQPVALLMEFASQILSRLDALAKALPLQIFQQSLLY